MLHLGSLLCCSIITSASLFDLLLYRVTLSSSILCLSSSLLCSSIVKSILCITSVSLFELLLYRQICRVTLSSSILCLSSSQLCSSVVKSILCYCQVCCVFPLSSHCVLFLYQVDNIVVLSCDVNRNLVYAYTDRKINRVTTNKEYFSKSQTNDTVQQFVD